MTSSSSSSVTSSNNPLSRHNDYDDGDDLFIPVSATSSVVVSDTNVRAAVLSDDNDDMQSVGSASDDIEMHAMNARRDDPHRHRHRHRRQREPIDPKSIVAPSTPKHRGRPDYRQFTFWQLRASLAEVLAEHPMVVNERDLGFTEYWNNEADEMLPACAYLALGFFCFVPWLVGCFYIRSRSPTARIAGILSAVLAFMLFAVLCVVLFNQFV